MPLKDPDARRAYKAKRYAEQRDVILALKHADYVPRGRRPAKWPTAIERARAWRVANRDRHRAYSRQWALDHLEHVRAKLSAWSAAHREQINARSRAYKRAHPELSREDARKRYLGRDNEVYRYSLVLRGDPCSYCSGPGGVVEHVVPLSRGGQNTIDNLTASCHKCNASKRSKSLLVFLLERAAA